MGSWLEDMDPHRYKHRRNPSKHSILANIPDLINKESQPKPFRFPRASSKTRDVPILEKEVEYEGKENFGERKSSRPEKRVTWSKDLLQVRSISPRQRQIQHRLASPRSSRINTITSSSSSTSTSPSNPSFASSFQSNFPSSPSPAACTHLGPTMATDCGHFLCHRVGRGTCQMEDFQGPGNQAQSWHGAGSQSTSTNEAQQSSGTSHQSYGTSHKPSGTSNEVYGTSHHSSGTSHHSSGTNQNSTDVLPCSPQLKTVVWRSVPINRTGLSLDFRQNNVV